MTVFKPSFIRLRRRERLAKTGWVTFNKLELYENIIMERLSYFEKIVHMSVV